ncbi:hypothetical protein AB0H49_08295 [Nocardia sp. NPDC050713]|uniref:hypothetical protein n=1 Tax=unclassified Nocardia TaxID=2637762 RepID=UPI0033AD241D
MTVLKVPPQTYYDAADICATAASGYFNAFKTAMRSFGDTTNMAGSVGDGKKWAESYDQQAKDVYGMSIDLVLALDGYAQVLKQAGYNHAIADYDPASGRPAPEAPNLTPSFTLSPQELTSLLVPPSAGGPGRGLVDDGLELAAKIGVPVPDGDTEKLSHSADVWHALANNDVITATPGDLERAAAMFEQVTSPDANFIDEDLREIKAAASDLAGAYAELTQACREQKQAHDKLREDLHKTLIALRDALLQELAINAAIGVASSFVSFGVGAALAAAKTAKAIDNFVDILRGVVNAAKLKTVVTIQRVTATTRKTIQRIKDLTTRLVAKINSKKNETTGRLFSRSGSKTNKEILESGDHLPLTIETVREYAKKAGIDLEGVEINLAITPDDVAYYDWAGAGASAQGNSINLAPGAFASEEALIRNLIHERVHVQQFRDGRTGASSSVRALEDEAYAADEVGWLDYQKRAGR